MFHAPRAPPRARCTRSVRDRDHQLASHITHILRGRGTTERHCKWTERVHCVDLAGHKPYAYSMSATSRRLRHLSASLAAKGQPPSATSPAGASAEASHDVAPTTIVNVGTPPAAQSLCPPSVSLSVPLSLPPSCPLDRRLEVCTVTARQSYFSSEQVRAYAIKLPDVRMICVVKISTAGGLYGVGESGLSFRELAVKGVSGAVPWRSPLNLPRIRSC